METRRYTASGRLGVWNSLPGDRDRFLSGLAALLKGQSHAVLESESVTFVPTADASLAYVAAICDKIFARGNPTLVDLDFEKIQLQGPCKGLIDVKEIVDGSNVGFEFAGRANAVSVKDLLASAAGLLMLPFSDRTPVPVFPGLLPPHLHDLASEEEDLFLAQFQEFFDRRFTERLHRQVLFRDFLDQPDKHLAESRVDFALQIGEIGCVFEIDGAQHQEPKQQQLDQRRDALLRENGWRVVRVSAAEVRRGLHKRFKELVPHLETMVERGQSANSYASISEAVSKSRSHRAAYSAILLPLALQRCLRGLTLLYYDGVLDPARLQRILIIEEDLPVTVEAFRILYEVWNAIHTLAPGTPAPPALELDVIGGELRDHANLAHVVRHLDRPEGPYDLILAHGCLMSSGRIGPLEKEHFPVTPENLVRFRRAVGSRSERELQWCELIPYDLADVENAVSGQEDEEAKPIPAAKHDALLYFLRQVFRKRDFWDGQLRVVSRLLQGKPAIVLLPTGGGKSLTYQFSGLLMPGMTIVIDPLVSLMADQVENLKTIGIDQVDFIASQREAEGRGAVLRLMEAGQLAFIFVSPERLQIEDFRNQLRTVVTRFPVSLAVIDEAHCVSEWGHDFRPSYLHLPRNLQRYCADLDKRPPTLVGLTGTASFAVLTDIQLEMQVKDEDAIILPRSFDRKELRFDIRPTPMAAKKAALKSLKMQLPRLLRSNPQHFYELQGDRTNSGIVFCAHVNGSLGVTDVAAVLGHDNLFSGQKPKKFPGGYSDWNAHKIRVQQEFKKNRVQELVATKSFGMGIDKPNIRYTIHYTVPQSVEAFYQEAGRAGRNGIPDYARCFILYSDDNWDSALEILNEPDHKLALSRLGKIGWDDRGDLLVQLWLLFNSYGGREQEKASTLEFWRKKLAPGIAGMRLGATNTREIPHRDERGRVADERAIFRLMLLGVVEDYTINWQHRQFAVRVRHASPKQIKEHLRNYLMQYKFEDFAESAIRRISEDSVDATLGAALDLLIDFIYDEIVVKRKQALRTMGELCRNFRSDQDFREAILAYLQESEFSAELGEWRNRSFDAIGLKAIRELLDRITTLEELKRLVGSTRRLLDEDPLNLALRYLSMCSRAQSAVESDASVLQEAETLAIQIDGNRKKLRNADELLLAALADLGRLRPNLLDRAADMLFRQVGTVSLARLAIKDGLLRSEVVYGHSLVLLTASSLLALANCRFFGKEQEVSQHGQG